MDPVSPPAPADDVPAPANTPAVAAVRVWDLPTRLFHWTLLAAVTGLIITGHVGGSAMAWHFRLGYLVLALVVFRVVWGLVGGRWSRFVHFVRGPSTVLRYLRSGSTGDPHGDVGHNPLGALSVLGMLGMLALQVACGLVADDEIANVGPLNRFVSTDIAALATAWHKDPGQIILIALIVLHVGAILFYRLRKRQDLITPMVRGDKTLPPDVPASRDDGGSRVLALVLFAACVAGAVAVSRLAN